MAVCRKCSLFRYNEIGDYSGWEYLLSETNSQIPVKILEMYAGRHFSKPFHPLSCSKAGSKAPNAWQVFIQLLYVGIIFLSFLPIAMKVAQYFMWHSQPVKSSLGRAEY